jgi:ribosomal-protein-alanine N-acetyltransferase
LPPTIDLTVRDASESDYPAIARIQQRCPEASQWPVGDYSNFRVLVALLQSHVVGFCAWRQSAPDEAELLNLGVDPAFRRLKVGSALLQALDAAAQGTLFLEVAETNAAARALYERHGWETIGLRRGYYQGKVHAVVMKKGS